MVALGAFASVALGGSDSESASAAYYYEPPPRDADLSIDMVGPANVQRGRHVVYTITIANDGPAPVVAPQLTDFLPPGQTDAEASPSQGSCFASSAIHCDLGELLPGESATVEIAADTASSPLGSFMNFARVDSFSELDPVLNNNGAYWTTQIVGDNGH